MICETSFIIWWFSKIFQKYLKLKVSVKYVRERGKLHFFCTLYDFYQYRSLIQYLGSENSTFYHIVAVQVSMNDFKSMYHLSIQNDHCLQFIILSTMTIKILTL